MSSDFQVIIASYNRRENIVKLVNDINDCNPSPKNVIVVDATVEENSALKENANVIYLHNLRHKNQPYQRLVGAYAAESEYIIFMDDDLEILDKGIFGDLVGMLRANNAVAVTAGIEYEGKTETKTFASSAIGKALLFLTGRPIVKQGQLGLIGHAGGIKSLEVSKTERLHGPVMGFKRSVFLKLPDPLFLSIFEQKMAIPEDKILSIRALSYGSLLYLPKHVVKHPQIKSTYFTSIYDHSARVHFSRFLINVELSNKNRRRNKELYLLHYRYYSFWRKIIAFSRSIINPKSYTPKYKGFLLAEQWVANYLQGAIPVNDNIIKDAENDSRFH